MYRSWGICSRSLRVGEGEERGEGGGGGEIIMGGGGVGRRVVEGRIRGIMMIDGEGMKRRKRQIGRERERNGKSKKRGYAWYDNNKST